MIDPLNSEYIIAKGLDFAVYNLRALFYPCWEMDFIFRNNNKEVSGEMHRLNIFELKEKKAAGDHLLWPELENPVEMKMLPINTAALSS